MPYFILCCKARHLQRESWKSKQKVSFTTMISLDVIEALLSSDSQRRQAAEAHFQSVDVNQRVLAWPAVWPTVTTAAVAHLVCVLWRRDILNCTVDTASLLAPLQQILGSAPDDRTRAAIGYCLAEVVARTATSAALEQVLTGTESLVSGCCFGFA